MVRIRWRDGVPRRRSYAFLKFDENGVSLNKWPKATWPRLKFFFRLNQHRLWFEIVEDAPKVVAPPSPAPETKPEPVGGGVESVPLPDDAPPPASTEASDEDHVERRSDSSDDPPVRAEPAASDTEGDGHLGTPSVYRRKGRRPKGQDPKPS